MITKWSLRPGTTRRWIAGQAGIRLPYGKTGKLTGLLNGFLAGLTEKEADIFMKRYYFLLSAPEIASEYRLRDNHIRSILSKTRKKLKRYVREALN